MKGNLLIIKYTEGVLKTHTNKRRKTRKIQGKVKGSGSDNRMGIVYQGNYGMVESTRCTSLERAKERCSHQGKYGYGQYYDTIAEATYYDAEGHPHDVTPTRLAESPGKENFRANLPYPQAGHMHGTRAMRAQRKKFNRKLQRDMDMVNANAKVILSK